MERKKIRCQVCGKYIKQKHFRVVQIFKANYEDRFIQQALSNCEKDLNVCNKCVLNLNFREFKQDKSGDCSKP